MENQFEIIIIGAGPGGISMAAEAIHSGIDSKKILILEKEQEHSWSIRKFYPDQKKVMVNYKGQAAVCYGVMCINDSSKAETLSYLDKSIADNKISVKYQETVNSIKKISDPIENDPQQNQSLFEIVTNKQTYITRTCVIAIGIMGRPNKPSFKIPAKIRSIVHHDISFTTDKIENVLVVGGGDSASEYAQYLCEKGHHITFSYRKAEFSRMNDINLESLNALVSRGKIKLLMQSNITAIDVLAENTDNIKISPQFEEAKYNDQNTQFDRMILALGGSTPLNFLAAIGIHFEGNNPVLKEGYETSLPGLFLIGDLSAGKKGGSIISAFTSSHMAMKNICTNYLECSVKW